LPPSTNEIRVQPLGLPAEAGECRHEGEESRHFYNRTEILA